MKILGIGGQGYRDSSAALVVDGEIVAAASEERFTNVKHEGGFPHRSIEFCLSQGGIDIEGVDRIAIANNSWLNLRDRLAEWYGDDFLESRRFQTYHIFHDEMHRAVRYLAEVERLRISHGERMEVVRHHLCHMAEAFYLSPFSSAAILAIDGRGEVSTSSLGWGGPDGIAVSAVEQMPSSIGLLCAAVADFLGFRDEDDEFRIMSISSLGEPRYLEDFRRILRTAPDGRYELNPDYFDTIEGRAFLSDRFREELGPGREPGTEVGEHHADVAASLQGALEEVALHMAEHLAESTGQSELCLAGGVAQNWVLGGRLRADGPFRQVHTGFAPGDEGTALGAALYLGVREGDPRPKHRPPFLGPDTTPEEIRAELERIGLEAVRPDDPIADAADRIAKGRLVGWLTGRMEFGPRALGHRSILVNPTDPAAKERLIRTVKPRARYHPFGIAICVEDLDRYFEDTQVDAHMASHRSVRESAREALAPVIHTDGTARVQTVSAADTPGLHALIRSVGERTGVPVVLNTSLNTPGKPLARTARDAIEVFYTSGLNDLYLEGARLSKPGDQQ